MSAADAASEKQRVAASTAIALLRRYWSFMRPNRAWIFLGLAMIPIVAAVTAGRPLLLKQAIDVHIPGQDLVGLRRVSWLFFGAIILQFGSSALQVYSLQRAGHETIARTRAHIFRHVLRLPNAFYDRNPIGSLLSRTTSDVEALSETLSFGVFTILTDVVMIAAVLTAMFVLSAKLTLISLSIAPILFFLVRYFSSTLRKLQLEIRRAQAVRTGYLAEQLSGLSVVQLFGREEAAGTEYAALGERYLRATKTSNIFDSLLFSVMEGISAFSIALLLWFAAPQVGLEEGLSIGLLYAFISYLQRIFVPIREFSSKLATIQRAAASLERIYRLLDEPPEPRSDVEGVAPAAPLEGWKGHIRVRDLGFAYGDGPQVLKGLDFEIEPGQVVAVVGRTGSGKSSLGRVFTRLYEGYTGSIELVTDDGGVELSSVPPDLLRKQVLMVLQDVFLFDDDVRFNVGLGQISSPEELDEALETVQARALVESRGGHDFGVGERGRNLSVGEAQLLAFARVAVRDPTFLILDEATASVDSHTEQRVQAAIERLLEGRSVLVIAHRLSTIRHADKVIVLADGGIAEMGSHDELMAAEGIYAQLYRSGLSEAEDGAAAGSAGEAPYEPTPPA